MIYTEADKKANIMELQKFLYGIARHNKSIPVVIPDGFYGPETAAAVSAFQKEYGLPVTGEVDKDTWETIVLIYNHLINNLPKSIEVFPNTVGYVLKPGDQNFLVYILQIMLTALKEFYINIPAVIINGIYSSDTTDAVNYLQKISNIPVTGNVDKYTWNSIVRLFEYISNTK